MACLALTGTEVRLHFAASLRRRRGSFIRFNAHPKERDRARRRFLVEWCYRKEFQDQHHRANSAPAYPPRRRVGGRWHCARVQFRFGHGSSNAVCNSLNSTNPKQHEQPALSTFPDIPMRNGQHNLRPSITGGCLGRAL